MRAGLAPAACDACVAILIPRRNRAAEQIRNNFLRNTNRNEGIICYRGARMRAVLAFRQAFVLPEPGPLKAQRAQEGDGQTLQIHVAGALRPPLAAQQAGLNRSPPEWPVALVLDPLPPDSHWIAILERSIGARRYRRGRSCLRGGCAW